MTSSVNNRLSALSVCPERDHRGQRPKNFWSTSSSPDTPRRRPTWRSWSTATAAGSPRATGRNPAPMNRICEFAVIARTFPTGSHVGDTDPMCGRSVGRLWQLLLKTQHCFWKAKVRQLILSGHVERSCRFSPFASVREVDSDVDTCPMWTFPTVRPTSMNKLQKGYTHTDSEVGHLSAQLHTHTHTHLFFGFLWELFSLFTVRRFGQKTTQVSIFVCLGHAHFQRGRRDSCSSALACKIFCFYQTAFRITSVEFWCLTFKGKQLYMWCSNSCSWRRNGERAEEE